MRSRSGRYADRVDACDLAHLRSVRSFYAGPGISRHFSATLAELDALIAEREAAEATARGRRPEPSSK